MKKSLPIHPFLFGLFPVLFTFAYNRREVLFSEITAPVLIIFVSTFFMLFFGWLVTRTLAKAAILVSAFWITVFSYGHALNILNQFFLKKMFFAFEYFFLLFICIGYGIFAWKMKKNTDTKNLAFFNRLLNLMSIILVVIQMFKIGGIRTLLPKHFSFQDEMQVFSAGPVTKPTIYYIILDGYARSDILKEIYGYDNSAFLGYLAERGFYIADKSSANYCQTALSLSSSLNYTYLDELSKKMQNNPFDRTQLFLLISKNKVIDFLKKQGYAIVAFSSGYPFTEIKAADVYVSPIAMPTLFQMELLNATPMATLWKMIPSFSMYSLRRKHELFTLGRLSSFCRSQGPVFVFAHILAPHPPFIFSAKGQAIRSKLNFTFADGSQLIRDRGFPRKDYLVQYRDQLIFINGQIKNVLDSILTGIKRPAVIILQSEHGPGSQLDWNDVKHTNLMERMGILNAYYFSDRDYKDLYASITPVNTFRVVFNHYFHTSYGLLEDRSFFSTWFQPFEMTDVTGNIRSSHQ